MLHFALVGYGRIGQVHAREIQRVGKLVAVCDIDVQKMDAVSGSEKVGRYQSLKDLLDSEKDVDVVVIATPNGLHAKQSIAALNAGKHVLCEKPMAINTSDAQGMIAAARKYERHLVVVKQNRYNPPVQELKQLLEGGQLGKVLSIQVNAFWSRKATYYKDSAWRGSLELDGGTLFTQFSHFVDLMIWLFGGLKDVKGFRANANHNDLVEFEDQGVLAMQFESGVLGTLHYTVNAYEQNMEGSIAVFGEKGTVKVGGAYLNEMSYLKVEGLDVFEGAAPADRRVENNLDAQGPNLYPGYQGSMSNHPMVYDDLVRLLNGENSSLATPEEGLRTVQAIEKIYSAIHVE